MSKDPSEKKPPEFSAFSHLDEDGAAQMVHVGQKPISLRTAVASAVCKMNLQTADAVRAQATAKGDVLQVARLAAISAAKRTDELIPLCHSLPLDSVEVEFRWVDPQRLEISVRVRATGRTGVEMEAMTAASVGALTVYDMCKASDRAMEIGEIRLLRKTGGVRGDYERNADSAGE